MIPTAEEFELVILGGGPGGYAAALYGASAGMHVAMIEESRVGGTCLNCGCIPAKELLETATVLRTVARAAEFGVQAGSPTVDLAVSQVRKQQVVDRLVGGLETLLKGRKVTVVPGTGNAARRPRPARARLRRQRAARPAPRCSRPARRPARCPATSSTARASSRPTTCCMLDHVPERVAVIGGGAIGCEFASFLVDVGQRRSRCSRRCRRCSPASTSRSRSRSCARSRSAGMKVHTGVQVGPARARREVGDRAVHREERRGAARGRRRRRQRRSQPAHVRVSDSASRASTIDERGFVAVDGQMRTSLADMYAVGDVVADPAARARRVRGGDRRDQDDARREPAAGRLRRRSRGASTAIPEVAFCGLTEEQARATGRDIVTSVHRFGGNGRALIIGEPDGLVKIVAERDGPLLGVHIVGPWATELIAEGYLSVNWEATAADLGLLIHAHPTLSELFGESALALTGRSLHG